MQNENIKQKNFQPFDVIKNARNKNQKPLAKIRKSSYQNPAQHKKKRKMTVAIQNQNEFQNEEEILQEKMEMQDDVYPIDNISKENLLNLSENQDKCSVQNDKDLQKGIPFDLDQRELDRESPYLRSFEAMDDQLDQMNIEQQN